METIYSSSAESKQFAQAWTLFWLLLVVCVPGVAAADTTAIALSADTEGHTQVVRQCCGDPGSGGLERRGSLVKSLRSQDPDMLLLDAGNSFFGGDSLPSRGEVISAAYDSLGYDAINVSYRDFRLGRDATLELMAGRKLLAVSANLIDETTGKLLFQPFLVKQVAGERIAILGVTQSPVGLDFLPHLKPELAGIRIQPLDEALTKWLPQAHAEADRVILLYYGSAVGLQPLAEKFGSRLDVILAGGVRQYQLRPDAQPPQIGTEEHGRELALLRLPLLGAKTQPKIEHILIEQSLKPDPEMEKLLDKYK